MKLYYYFLFRIYRFYIDTLSDKSAVLFSVTAVSTVVVYFVLFSIYAWLNYFDFVPMLANKYYVVLVMSTLGIINYFLFIRTQKFLNFNFKKDVKGGVIITLFVMVIISLTIIESNLNRKKIFQEQTKNSLIEHVKKKKDQKPKSLEGRIRKWFRESF